MNKNLLLISFIVMTVFFGDTCAHSSGIGVIGPGPFNKTTGGNTGNRERVELYKAGELLVGKPKKNKYVELITIHATSLSNGHIILRELKNKSNENSFLISSPNFIKKNTSRMTLYINAIGDQNNFYEYYEGSWEKHDAIMLMKVDELKNMHFGKNLNAYCLPRMGLFCLTDRNLEITGDIAGVGIFSTGMLPGGNISRGLLPLICAILVLLIGIAISIWSHKKEKAEGL